MESVYENCPVIEDESFLLRQVSRDDTGDLLKVYSDKRSLPFFNSDNCHGDNFYYTTEERMRAAIDFWLASYERKKFVRWTIIDKRLSKAIGTAEMFHRTADDDLNDTGVLRLDVKSGYEVSEKLERLFALFIPSGFELFGCTEMITKIPVYAVERINAAKKNGFVLSESFLVGTYDHYAYNGYWIVRKQT